jgi:hypothetical protein
MDVDASTRVAVVGFPIPPPPINGRVFTYPTAFSGGTSLANATPVTVEPGVEHGGLDIRLEPQPAVRISGVVQGPPDAVSGLSLRLLAEGSEDLGMGGEAGTALLGPNGAFTFAGVPAGSYTIEASPLIASYVMSSSSLSMFYGPQLPRAPGLSGTSTIGGSVPGTEGLGFEGTILNTRKHWGRVTVNAGADGATGVVLTLRPVITVSGRLVGEADPNQSAPAEEPKYLFLEPATGAASLGQPRSGSAQAGSFTIEALPGLYHFRSDSRAWLIKSVIVNGHDHTYMPLDTSAGDNLTNVVVTFTNVQQSVDGIVTDATGAAVDGATVVVFPAEFAQWTNYGLTPPRIRSMRTPATGGFRFRAVPAGDYYAVALPGGPTDIWQTSGFFQRAQSVATRFTVASGETKALTLKPTEVR